MLKKIIVITEDFPLYKKSCYDCNNTIFFLSNCDVKKGEIVFYLGEIKMNLDDELGIEAKEKSCLINLDEIEFISKI